jgi:hypothetical protein
MAGALVLVVILVIFPLLVGIGSAPIAALLGSLLHRDRAAEYDGHELLDLNN